MMKITRCLMLAMSLISLGFSSTPFNFMEWTRNHQGNHAYTGHRYEKAMDSYERNTQTDAHNPGTHYNLGNTMVKMGQPDGGEKEWQQAMVDTKSKSLKSKVYFNKSVLDVQSENYSQAKDNLIKCLSYNPRDKDAKKNLELVLRQLRLNKQQQKKEQNKPGQGNDRGKQEKSDKQNQTGQTKPIDAKLSESDAKRILESFQNNKTLKPPPPQKKEWNQDDW